MTPKTTLTKAAMNDEPKLTCSALTVRREVAISIISLNGTVAALRASARSGIRTMMLR